MNLSEWEGWGWIGSLHAWQNYVGGTSVSNIFSNSSTRITRFWRLLVDQIRVVFLRRFKVSQWRFLSITMEQNEAVCVFQKLIIKTVELLLKRNCVNFS